jgi:hypothetical protein
MDTLDSPSTELENTVSTLFCWPILPALLKDASILAVLPGIIGSLGQLLAVQPHVVDTLLKIKGSVPVFLKVNTCFTISPCLISPKFFTSSLNLILGPLAGVAFSSEVGVCASRVKDAKRNMLQMLRNALFMWMFAKKFCALKLDKAN